MRSAASVLSMVLLYGVCYAQGVAPIPVPAPQQVQVQVAPPPVAGPGWGSPVMPPLPFNEWKYGFKEVWTTSHEVFPLQPQVVQPQPSGFYYYPATGCYQRDLPQIYYPPRSLYQYGGYYYPHQQFYQCW